MRHRLSRLESSDKSKLEEAKKPLETIGSEPLTVVSARAFTMLWKGSLSPDCTTVVAMCLRTFSWNMEHVLRALGCIMCEEAAHVTKTTFVDWIYLFIYFTFYCVFPGENIFLFPFPSVTPCHRDKFSRAGSCTSPSVKKGGWRMRASGKTWDMSER